MAKMIFVNLPVSDLPASMAFYEALGWEQGGPRAVRKGDWKIVWDQRQPQAQRRWQLFNLATDRSEQHDLAATEPAKLEEMLRAWDSYSQESGVIY